MKIYLSILICVVLSSIASAQTAMQLFNPAAKEFIYGNIPVASNLVEQALLKFPDDEKLKKLKKLIEEQQQSQNQQNQNQQNQNQQNQDKQNQDQQQNEQKDQQKNQDQQKTDPDEQNPQQQNKNEQQNDRQDQTDSPGQDNQQDWQQKKPAGAMSPEEAQQLLDAMKQDEQDQRANLKPYLGNPVRVDKDW